jgi:hypothetical protein
MTTTRLSSPPATRERAPAAPRAPGGLRSLAVDIGVPLASVAEAGKLKERQ